jgi:hypothetical protein
MTRSRVVAVVALAGSVVAPAAFAQADNSNSLTFPDRLWIALIAPPATVPDRTVQRSPLDEVLATPTASRHSESLDAIELGLLYGIDVVAPAGDVP